MSRRGRLFGALLILGCSAQAQALEYCVTCEGPAAMYRCVIAGTPEGAGSNPTSSLYCISEMAKRGGHEKCGVSRGAPIPCPGLTAEITQSIGNAAPPATTTSPEPQPPEPAPANSKAGQQPETPPPSKVPRTVEELANETVKSSQEGIQKAGEAIGGTAKKAGEQIGNAGSAIGNAASQTWTCLSSFFSNCGGEEQPETPSGPSHNERAPE